MPYQIPGIEVVDEDGHTEVMYEWITYEEIQGCITPFLAASLELYSNFVLLGVLPHGQGTLGERETVIEILKILKSEDNRYQNWEMEQKLHSEEK